MAEGKDCGVEELEREITCAVCHEYYNEPKVLSCCHYYCKRCIYSIALKTGLDKPFSCPECRKDTTLPQGSVDNLQAAFFINRMKVVHSKLERATGKVEAKCEMCSGATAEAFCRQCMMFICAECVKQHQKLKVFAGHKTSSLAELKEGGAKEVLVQEPTMQTCNLHEQQMNVYCFDCGCLICRDCTIKNHHGHNYEFIKKAVHEAKKKLAQHLNPLRETKLSLSCAVKEIQTTRSEVEAQGHSVATRIENSFDELQQVIEHHKQQLLTEAASNTTCKLDCLSGQEKSLSMESAMVQSVIKYAEQCIEHLADDEIMCMQAELQSRIDREIEQQKEGKNLEPVEEADMAVEVSCVEELKHLCQTKAKIINFFFDPSKCTVTAKGKQNAEIRKVSGVTVRTNLANGKPTKQKCVVECHLKSLADGSTTKCKVYPINDGEYSIQYTPTVRGRHELTVTVNGVEVANSPIPVFVSIHPNKLGKPVRVIPGLKRPTGVAITSEGEIVVSEFKDAVVALDRKGNRLRSINRSHHNLKKPRGVAVDGDDNIYFVDQDMDVIFKSDKQMKKVFQMKTPEKFVPGNLSVTVVRGEVMVCERGNQGTIKVYNKKLEYVREIVLPPGRIPNSTSSDEHGNLYVSNKEHFYVDVISNGGKFLRSFDSDGRGVKKLNRPYVVCVAGQYVYVTDYGNHEVSVFTTDGQYVTSFGQKGGREGDFNRPIGVCVDRDGFVYVCDYLNDRVQIF